MSRTLKPRIIVGDVAWKDQGRCNGDPQATDDLYAKYEAEQRDAARRWCFGCPVRETCLEFAVANREEFGVWGGLSENDRRRYTKDHRQRIAS